MPYARSLYWIGGGLGVVGGCTAGVNMSGDSGRGSGGRVGVGATGNGSDNLRPGPTQPCAE
jgi:hypothetical protein